MMEFPKTSLAPESKKILKHVPETYHCHLCPKDIPIANYLNHLELAHDVILRRDICVHGPIYNDVTAWKRSGDNVLEHKMLFITDDGRFPGFKKINGSDNSTDGSKELILSYPNTMYFAHGEDYEESKFNFAMHVAGKMGFKYVILLGSDEWVVGDIQKLVDKLNQRMKSLPQWESQAFHVAIDEHQPENKWNRFITESPKIYYGPGLLRTRFTHWLRYSSTQIAKEGTDNPIRKFQKRICDVVIHHDDSIRGKERNALMTKFQDKNVEREQQRILREAFFAENRIRFFITTRKMCDFERDPFFTKAKMEYTHYIILDDDIKLEKRTLAQIHKTLFQFNHFDVLSVVWNLGKDKSWSLSLNPPDVRYATDKLYEIYHKAKFVRKQRFFAVTIELGPIIVLTRQVAEKITRLHDKKKFLLECQLHGFRVFADSSIQVKKK